MTYKLIYRIVNPKGGCPHFVPKVERHFPNRGAAEHRAEELEAKGALIIKVAEERKPNQKPKKPQSILEK